MSATTKGLEGIVIGETRLSKVNGEIGKLTYSGYNIMDLAEHALFEEVIYLLWNKRLPNQSEFDVFTAELRANQSLNPTIITMMKSFPKDAHPMAVLRTVVSALGLFDAYAENTSLEANLRKATKLTAVMGTIIAAWERIRNGQEPIAPDENLNLAEDFLKMLKGEAATEAEIRAINTYLVLLADHGVNASTFTSRVVTSTLSDMYSAITGAIGALKGPAHGGANQKAMEQFMEIGSLENAQSWFEHAMENKIRIMGIGHRVYKAEDPRGTVLRERARAIAQAGESKWFDIAYKIEELSRQNDFFVDRNLYPNVDYYSAIVLRSSGIEVDQFTPLFAMSRVAGWCAHVIEQWADNRLIRPRAEYVGPMDLEWTPISER